mmetsp:Transcript_42114/g.133743  ORF Transcript_42114/g.133743 Transcript_42114/m.133743 type:complete len:229 (-) Transcript_42114:354-1040(-)
MRLNSNGCMTSWSCFRDILWAASFSVAFRTSCCSAAEMMARSCHERAPSDRLRASCSRCRSARHMASCTALAARRWDSSVLATPRSARWPGQRTGRRATGCSSPGWPSSGAWHCALASSWSRSHVPRNQLWMRSAARRRQRRNSTPRYQFCTRLAAARLRGRRRTARYQVWMHAAARSARAATSGLASQGLLSEDVVEAASSTASEVSSTSQSCACFVVKAPSLSSCM